MSKNHGINLPGVLLDEIRSNGGSTGGPRGKSKFKKQKVSRKEKRKEKRLGKKNHNNHSNNNNNIKPIIEKQETSIDKKPLKSAFNTSKKKKSVSVNESLNTLKMVKSAYKKSDFFQEPKFGEEEFEDDDTTLFDSDESDFESNYGKKRKKKSQEPKKTAKEIMEDLIDNSNDDEDDYFSDFSGDSDVSDLDDPNQPQTAEEVFAALAKAKSQPRKGKAKSQPKKEKAKTKTAREIMEELNGKNEEENEDEYSDFSGDSDVSDLDDPNQPQTAEEVFAALAKAKSQPKKSAKKEKKTKTAKEIMEALNANSNEEEEDDDDFSEFSGDSDFSDLEGPKQPKTSEEVFAALAKAKSKPSANFSSKKEKAKKTAKEIMEELNGKNEEENDEEFSDFSGDSDISDLDDPNQPQTAEEVFAALAKAKSQKSSTKKFEPKQPDFLNDEALRDEDDMRYYAKKLGLKSGMKLSKTDDDDLIGGLFDGLDFMESYEEGMESSETEEIVEDEEPVKKVKENPYVAPVSNNTGRKYVPPALRRLQNNEDDAERVKIQRIIKGQLNKLSDINIVIIANEINQLYFENARHLVNETLTKTILESIYSQSKLLDNFVILHAGLIAAVYRLQGSEFLVYFIQSLVENYESFHEKNLEDNLKQSNNLLSLLTYCYTLQIISCGLIYDIIKNLLINFNEYNSELLLRLVKNSGSQLRSDDPLALKEIISLMYENTKGIKLSPRTNFLIESIENLKNNKIKKDENNNQLIIKIKKFLGNLNNNKAHDPLAITLDDLHNVDKRGKWWLTGSAWKGKIDKDDDGNKNDNKNEEESIFENVNSEAIDDILDNSEPNWLELAKNYRMNNDIRRAIFISIMSSDDYMDAFTKLDKLQLKRNQQREIPGILLHCQQLEATFNKFYGLLAGKLCSEHLFRKNFEFNFWNLLKELNNEDINNDDLLGKFKFNDDETEDEKLIKLTNSSKFFGFLIGIDGLQLNMLRNVDFLTINENSKIFLEILFLSFFEEFIKKSNSQDYKKLILKKFEKVNDLLLIKGIQFFLKKNVKGSTFMKKKLKEKIESLIEIICKINSD